MSYSDIISNADNSQFPNIDYYIIEQFDNKGLKLNLKQDIKSSNEIKIDGELFDFSHYGIR